MKNLVIAEFKAQPGKAEELTNIFNEALVDTRAVSYTHLTLPTICSV